MEYERIEQSDTWAIAEEVPMAQHALLFMWLAAWKQEPCGSFPNDEAVIRSKCRVPLQLWPTLRDVMLRGWWLADDGRLYHPTITARVVEMLEYRRKTAERVAKHKAAMRDERLGNALPTVQAHVKNDTGTGTGTDLKKQIQDPPPASLSAPPEKAPRASRRCPADFTPTAELIAEAGAAGVNVARELAKFKDHTFKTARSDWPATFRNWLRDAADRAKPAGGSFLEAKQAEGSKWFKGTSFDRSNTIDMELSDAAQLALR